MGKLFNVSSSPHVRSSHTTQAIMFDVAIAMLPARTSCSDCNSGIMRAFRVYF